MTGRVHLYAQADHGSFQTFGLQCETLPDSAAQGGSIRQITTSRVPSVAAQSTQDSKLISETSKACNAYTMAPLDNLKQMRFSCRTNNRPRHGYEDSGLWFEYFPPRPPSILGQWISEVDAITFDEGEELIEVIVWMSKLRYSRNVYYHQGRVVKISVLTSLNQAKSVPADNELLAADDSMILRFQANRLEKLASPHHRCRCRLLSSCEN